MTGAGDDFVSVIRSGLRGSTTSAENLKTMNTASKKIALLAAVLVLVAIVGHTAADMADVAICIRNCAQCKKMLGDYFEGSLCADSCVKFKGKMIPDCENIDSIAPFLNKLK
ncbi:hypothetical protein QTP88_027873 [Uroleucon formosanum]